MNIPHIHLRAYRTGMLYAWQEYFEHVENVTISQGDILRETADAIVSPANSTAVLPVLSTVFCVPVSAQAKARCHGNGLHDRCMKPGAR